MNRAQRRAAARRDALTFDTVMRTLTETDRQTLRKRVPVHVVDQFDAAASHADRIFEDTARQMNAKRGECEYAKAPAWLRLSLAETWSAFTAGTVDTCQHAPSINRPEPVVAAVWRPNLLACINCIHLTKATGAADLTCDRCRRVCAGLPDDGIHPCSLTFGPLIYFYGLCRGCMALHSEATP
jgi:hypothetical protein